MVSLPLATFLAGVGVGLAVAVPIGPMGVLCVQRTLAFGLAAGLAIGLAAATVQVTYSLVVLLGLSPVATALVGTGAGLLSVLSAALLFWFAYRILRCEVVIESTAPGQPLCLLRSYRDALTFGFTNPLTIILFFAAFPALTSADDVLKAPILVSGVFAGAIGWYVVLSSTVALAREWLPTRALNITNKASGLALAGLGLLMVGHAIGLHLN